MNNKDKSLHLYNFKKKFDEIKDISYKRDLDIDDIHRLNWVVRNIRRLKDYKPEDLGWDDSKKEILIIKQ